jgi:hypothetical protein
MSRSSVFVFRHGGGVLKENGDPASERESGIAEQCTYNTLWSRRRFYFKKASLFPSVFSAEGLVDLLKNGSFKPSTPISRVSVVRNSKSECHTEDKKLYQLPHLDWNTESLFRHSIQSKHHYFCRRQRSTKPERQPAQPARRPESCLQERNT